MNKNDTEELFVMLNGKIQISPLAIYNDNNNRRNFDEN